MAPFLREHSGGVFIAVKVVPRASKTEIGEVVGDELKIKVTAPPVDSAANEALLTLLADRLETSRSSLQLARGKTSRHKVVFVAGMSIVEAERKLVEV
jgi:uncharacterized protein